MKIALFGTYPRGQGYPRASVLKRALVAGGLDVSELHVDLGLGVSGRVRSASSLRRYPDYLFRFLKARRRLTKLFHEESFDVLMVGPTGYLDALLAGKLVSALGKKRPCLVFDPFFSLTETMVEDRGYFSPGSLRARLISALEKKAAGRCDGLLADTNAHADHFSDAFGFPRHRIGILPVGSTLDPAPDTAPYQGLLPGEPLRVLYVGSFIPLHGLETVVRAGEVLSGKGIEIRLVGDGQCYPSIQKMAESGGKSVVEISRGFQSGKELEEHFSWAHVALGVFGEGKKCSRVVPCKVYDALMRGIPLVTGDTVAARELLSSGRDAILTRQGDPGHLAAALLGLKQDPGKLDELAKAGKRLFDGPLSDEEMGRNLRQFLESLVGSDGAGKRANRSYQSGAPSPRVDEPAELVP